MYVCTIHVLQLYTSPNIQFSTNEIVENIFLHTLELVPVSVVWFLDVFVCCFVLFNTDFGWKLVVIVDI